MTLETGQTTTSLGRFRLIASPKCRRTAVKETYNGLQSHAPSHSQFRVGRLGKPGQRTVWI